MSSAKDSEEDICSSEAETSDLQIEKSHLQPINILGCISTVLQKISESLDSTSSKNTGLEAHFRCKHMPGITFIELLTRFKEYGSIIDDLQVAALMYLDRSLRTGIFKSRTAIHKLYSTCLFLSVKLYNENQAYGLDEFSKLCGVPKKELQTLEVTLLLDILQCDILIQEGAYKSYIARLALWLS